MSSNLVMTWSRDDLEKRARQHALADDHGDDTSWVDATMRLYDELSERRDYALVYVNTQPCSEDWGKWKVVSYGGPEAHLKVVLGAEAPRSLPSDPAYRLRAIVPYGERSERVRVTLSVELSAPAGVLQHGDAARLVDAAVRNGVNLWSDTAGHAGFSDQDDTGLDAYDCGARFGAITIVAAESHR